MMVNSQDFRLVPGTKRGAHMALSVERLDRLTEEPVQRIGLSATQRPMEEIGRFVSGGRPIEMPLFPWPAKRRPPDKRDGDSRSSSVYRAEVELLTEPA